MKRFLLQRWFLIALAVVLTTGFFFAGQLEFIAAGEFGRISRMVIVASVLFVMSLPLGFGSFYRSVRIGPALLATGINYGIIPVAGWAIYCCVAPLIDQGLAIGILVAAATPSTLASAAVWTRRAGGNDTVAILVTIITNASCFVVTPCWLYWMTGTQVAALSVSGMIVKLLLLVVLPMAAAQGVRLIPSCGRWATQRRTLLGVLAQAGVLAMILLGSINAGVRIQESGESLNTLAADLGLMIVSVIGLHLSMLFLGHLLAAGCGIQRPERIAVGFSGSQKTLMVGLAIAVDDYAKFGLAVLPMVTYHVGQLLVDTIIADRLKRAEPSDE